MHIFSLYHRAERDAQMARELQSQLTDSQRDEQRRKQLHDEVSIPSVSSCRSGVGSPISMLLIKCTDMHPSLPVYFFQEQADW